jgi:transcriptional regulator with XRE-family HTH domain
VGASTMFITKIKVLYNVTEKEIARRIGISRSQLYRIKTGQSSTTAEFLEKLKKAFPAVDLNEVVEEINRMKQKTKELKKKA